MKTQSFCFKNGFQDTNWDDIEDFGTSEYLHSYYDILVSLPRVFCSKEEGEDFDMSEYFPGMSVYEKSFTKGIPDHPRYIISLNTCSTYDYIVCDDMISVYELFLKYLPIFDREERYYNAKRAYCNER